MIIAAAQTQPISHNTVANLQAHYLLVELAARKNAQLIVFPEMSLTGYEREAAHELAFTENDTRLDELKALAALHKMIIIAGAPISINGQLHIGSFIVFPNNRMSIYTKQFLHTGEEIAFSPSSCFNPLIVLDGETISMAICADITNPLHPANAAKRKTTLYIASIFYSPNGIGEAYQQLSGYAATYNMNVLMANFGGPSYNGSASAGQSAFWNNKGQLLAKLDEQAEGLLVMERKSGVWNVLPAN